MVEIRLFYKGGKGMKELRSAQVTQGVERAPARSLFYAMGYTKEELACFLYIKKPFLHIIY